MDINKTEIYTAKLKRHESALSSVKRELASEYNSNEFTAWLNTQVLYYEERIESIKSKLAK